MIHPNSLNRGAAMKPTSSRNRGSGANCIGTPDRRIMNCAVRCKKEKLPNQMVLHWLWVALCSMTLTATGLASAQGSPDETAAIRNIPQQAREAADTHSDGATRVLNRGATISGGMMNFCAVMSDSTVRCWGSNEFGLLGNGITLASSGPVTVSGITTAVAVATGYDHSCAVLAYGRVQCWGSNDHGQLGDGTTSPSSVPVTVSGITTAVAVANGFGHSCALLADGLVQCWGHNHGASLSRTKSMSSVPVTLRGLTNAVAVAAGDLYPCAVLADGRVQCWGPGYGTTSPAFVPLTVSGFSTATAVPSRMTQRR